MVLLIAYQFANPQKDTFAEDFLAFLAYAHHKPKDCIPVDTGNSFDGTDAISFHQHRKHRNLLLEG